MNTSNIITKRATACLLTNSSIFKLMNGMRKSPLVLQPTEMAPYKTQIWGTLDQKLAGQVQCSEKLVPLPQYPPQIPHALSCYHNYTCLKPPPYLFSFFIYHVLLFNANNSQDKKVLNYSHKKGGWTRSSCMPSLGSQVISLCDSEFHPWNRKSIQWVKMWPPVSEKQGAENCLFPVDIRLKTRKSDNTKVKFLDNPQHVKQ